MVPSASPNDPRDSQAACAAPPPPPPEGAPCCPGALRDDTDQARAHPGDVLAQSLDQLRDPAFMKPILNSAFAQFTGGPADVADYTIEYCKIKPRRHINAALLLQLRAPDGSDAPNRRVSCTVYPTVEDAQQRYEQELRSPGLAPVRQRMKTEGFNELFALVRAPAMVVRLFPADPVLTGLGPATDAPAMLELLGEHVEPGRPRAQAMSYDVLHYKPGRSCAVHYELTRPRSNGSPPRTSGAYGKIYRDDRGELCYQLLCATWKASCASGSQWHAARPLLHVPQWRFVLQEAVPGRQFRHLFGDLTHDNASEVELRQVEQHLRAIALAIRSFQTSGIRLGPRQTFDQLLAGQERNLEHLDRTHAKLASDIARIREQLSAVARRVPASPIGFSHGDFAHGNVLIDEASGGAVGIIDFDRAGQTELAYDVAYFLTHMWSFGIRHPKRQAHVQRLCDVFRNAYLDLAPDVSPERLALYEALDFAAYVLRNFRKQSHQAAWFQWAQYQVQSAWDRLADARTPLGAAP